VLCLGDKREQHGALRAQVIDQISFVRAAESSFIDEADRGTLLCAVRVLATDDYVGICMHLAIS